MDSPSCIICLIDKEKYSKFPCDHTICTDCVKDYIHYSNKCPICTKEFMYYITPSNEKYELTNEDILLIQKNKKQIIENENFDCVTKGEIYNQLIQLKQRYFNLINKLFPPRNAIGNEKELSVLKHINKNIELIEDLLLLDEFEGRSIVQNLNESILEIKRLENDEYRYYKYEEDEETYNSYEDDGYNIEFDLNVVGKNKKKKRKKRK